MKASFLKPSVVLNCLLNKHSENICLPFKPALIDDCIYGAKFSNTFDWPSNQLKASSITLFINTVT